jgi:3',5'-cyclic AMP phosphodiesterase CpdA
MRKAFADQAYMPSKGFIHYVIDEYPVRLIGLDTVIPGKDVGEICQERMEWLKHVLEDKKEKPSLIFMHHPPAKIGNDLFDAIRCFVPDEFEKMISNQKNLLGIVTGHCHNFHATSYGNKPCFIAPSIAPGFYFARLSDKEISDLELDDPAITLHQWHGGGTLISDVIRLKAHNPRVTWQIIKEKNHL